MKRMGWAVPALMLAGAGLVGCGVTVPGTAVPAPVAPASKAGTQQTAPAPVTVTAPPVVVVQPQATVTRPTAVPALTPCQRLFADGYSYSYAYDEWAKAGYPLSWDADRDGYPCEQSYGNQN
jgi:hypothetical protein